MTSHVSNTRIIACSTLRDEVEALRGDIPVEYLKGFLHDTPDALRDALNDCIAATPGECTILLAYGRCSNGTAGISAGSHRLVLPICDDCISLLLGSRRAYRREFAAHPGTYYYTRGWAEELDDNYRIYLKMIAKVGEEKARELAHAMVGHYTRVAIIDTGTYDLPKVEAYVNTVAEFYGLPVHRLEGSLRLLEKLIRGPHDGEFLTVKPGEALEEHRFWDADSREPAPETPPHPPASSPAATAAAARRSAERPGG